MKLRFLFPFLLFALQASPTIAQDATNEPGSQEITLEQVIKNLNDQEKRELKLEELVKVISEERKNLTSLKKRQERETDNADIKASIEQQAQDLEIVQKSFEQIAIGGINLDVFNKEQEPQNWQEELTLIVKPLLENLRSLTEKPRKIESLKQTISLEKSASEAANLALASIDNLLAENNSNDSVKKELESVQEKWKRLLTESQRKQELAAIELTNLEDEDGDWIVSFKNSLKSFAQDRGLTLLLATIVAIAVILFFRMLTRLIEYLRSKKNAGKSRIAFRLIAYAQKFMSMIFAILGVLIVCFIRGDVLLMVLIGILLFAAALGLKNFIPQFLEESRILLDIGRVRENELVIVNGIPWRVASINIFTKLINPEIKGVLRLPLGDIKELVSRKISDETWFPSSIGDWILDDENMVYEVISQGPDSVELHSSQGRNKLIPSNEYYSAGFDNLTKSNSLRITSTFGVDYSLQAICLDEVPKKFQAKIQRLLENKNLGTEDINVRVDLQNASASSLDYLIIVNVNPIAAKHYYAIGRYIQQACIQTCNEENWTIPFPQLTISKQDN